MVIMWTALVKVLRYYYSLLKGRCTVETLRNNQPPKLSFYFMLVKNLLIRTGTRTAVNSACGHAPVFQSRTVFSNSVLRPTRLLFSLHDWWVRVHLGSIFPKIMTAKPLTSLMVTQRQFQLFEHVLVQAVVSCTQSEDHHLLCMHGSTDGSHLATSTRRMMMMMMMGDNSCTNGALIFSCLFSSTKTTNPEVMDN